MPCEQFLNSFSLLFYEGGGKLEKNRYINGKRRKSSYAKKYKQVHQEQTLEKKTLMTTIFLVYGKKSFS